MTYRTLVSSFALVLSAALSASAQTAGKWKIETRPAKDGGAPATLLELRGNYGVDPWPDPFFPILAVKCVADTPSVFVVTGGPAQPSAGNEAESSVFYHLDNRPRKNAVWARSKSADTLTAPDGAAMLHDLLGVKRFRFGFTLDHGDRTIFEFTPTGLDAALAKGHGACGSPE